VSYVTKFSQSTVTTGNMIYDSAKSFWALGYKELSKFRVDFATQEANLKQKYTSMPQNQRRERRAICNSSWAFSV
jgi:hypothetical protein